MHIEFGGIDHQRHFNAHLTVYHAVEVPDPSYAHWAFNRGREIWSHVEETARDLLCRKAEPGTDCRVVVERASSAHHALLHFIRETQPDLTVMATHGRQGLRHFLLGSVTESVFRHSFRPVLCVREPAHGAQLPYRRILVPTDLSLASRLAFPLAAYIARSFGAEVIAVHVTGASFNRRIAMPEGGVYFTRDYREGLASGRRVDPRLTVVRIDTLDGQRHSSRS